MVRIPPSIYNQPKKGKQPKKASPKSALIHLESSLCISLHLWPGITQRRLECCADYPFSGGQPSVGPYSPQRSLFADWGQQPLRLSADQIRRTDGTTLDPSPSITDQLGQADQLARELLASSLTVICIPHSPNRVPTEPR